MKKTKKRTKFKMTSATSKGHGKTHQSEKENVVLGFVGANETGKTSCIKELTTTWERLNPKKKVYTSKRKPPIGKIKNCLIIFDVYREKDFLYFQELLTISKHKNIDVMYAVHGLSYLTSDMGNWTTHYYIFMNNESTSKAPGCIPFANKLNSMCKVVSGFAELNGKGLHPKSPLFRGQTFPVAIYKIATQEVKFRNINL